jgi:hypothetical protein
MAAERPLHGPSEKSHNPSLGLVKPCHSKALDFSGLCLAALHNSLFFASSRMLFFLILWLFDSNNDD